jgi:hypothetical protein
VYAMDASGYFSRPGPRLMTGIEALAKVLHPEVVVSAEAQSVAVPFSVPSVAVHAPSVRAASAY